MPATVAPHPAAILEGLVESMQGHAWLRAVTTNDEVVVGRLLPEGTATVVRLRGYDNVVHTLPLDTLTSLTWTTHVPF